MEEDRVRLAAERKAVEEEHAAELFKLEERRKAQEAADELKVAHLEQERVEREAATIEKETQLNAQRAKVKGGGLGCRVRAERSGSGSDRRKSKKSNGHRTEKMGRELSECTEKVTEGTERQD